MNGEQSRFNPFPGLRAFQPQEDLVFFGRDKQTDDLLWRLRSNRFLPVVGASGSGKSSLLLCGVVPSLYSGYMLKAGSSWRVALLRPGNDPIGNLASALQEHGVVEELGEDEDLHRPLLEATLRSSALGLIRALRHTRIALQDNVLVVVDQFEELFRYRRNRKIKGSRDEAAAFVKLLIEAAKQEVVPIYVAIALRSEFLGQCSEYPGLTDAINRGVYLVPRFSREELKQAIVSPAVVAGGQIAPRLVTRLLNDAGDDPGHLAMLQHALMRMWHYTHRDGEQRPLDLRHYEATGTLAEALSRHAEEIYRELDAGHRQIAEKMFKALTDGTANTPEVRRPVRFEELCELTAVGAEEVRAVLESFSREGRSFLEPPAGCPIDDDSIIDLAHESLMRVWSRLTGWVEEEARSAEVYLRLAAAAALHREKRGGYWRDPELYFALRWRQETQPTGAWARRYDASFEPTMRFLEASRAEHSRAEHSRETSGTEARSPAPSPEVDALRREVEVQRRIAQEQGREVERLKRILATSTEPRTEPDL